MNTKGLKLFVLFLFSISLTMAFQNCGKSTAKSSSSDNGGLNVDVTPGGDGNNGGDGDGSGGDGDGSGGDGDGSGGNNEFSFDMSRGDNIYYSDSVSPDYRSLRVLSKQYYILAETTIYEAQGTTFQFDLGNNYCNNSALPHCLHRNTMSCQGEGCPDTSTPVACHWEKRMSQAEINNTFAALNNLVFITKAVNSSEQVTPNCDNPNLFFYSSVVNDINVSLAPTQCVPYGKYTVTSGGNNLRSIFDTELNRVDGAGDFCNNYSAYSWDKTKWSYSSNGGFTTELQRTFREANYDPARAAQTRIKLRWKNAGNNNIFCADVFFQNASEYNPWFPTSGLVYEIFRPQAFIADAPTAQVTYEDPMDGGAVRQFYLNRISAQSFSGGAVLQESQGTALRNSIEALIQRADTFGLTSVCN